MHRKRTFPRKNFCWKNTGGSDPPMDIRMFMNDIELSIPDEFKDVFEECFSRSIER